VDIDAAILWGSTRDEEALKQAKSLGVTERLLNGNAKTAWKFINEYLEKYGSIPSVGLIVENSGTIVKPPDEEDRVSLKYVVDQLYDRFQHKSLNYGLGKSSEALEQGNQQDAVTEVLKLADHLRAERKDQLQLHTLGDVAPDVLAMYEKVKRGEIGVPFPWPTMTSMCVSGDTLVYDAESGLAVRADEAGGRIATWSAVDGVHVRSTTFSGKTGRKQCLRMSLESGGELVGTPEHPVLTPEGWKKLSELKPGDSVAMAARYPIPDRVVGMPEAHVVLIAMLLAEGCFIGSHVRLANRGSAFAAEARRCAELIGCDLIEYQKGLYRFRGRAIRRRRKDGRFSSHRVNPAQVMLERYGVIRGRSPEKVIPDAVFRLGDRQIAQFVGTFWSGDGYVNVCGKGLGRSINLGIHLTSRKMVEQLRHLLLRLGIVSRFVPNARKPSAAGWHPSHRLLVPSEFHEKFDEVVGPFLLGDKARDMNRAMAVIRGRRFRVGNVVDIGGLKEALRGPASKRGVIVRVADGRNAESYDSLFIRVVSGGKRMSSSRIQVDVLRRLLAEVGGGDCRWIVDGNLWWDSVAIVEPEAVRDVYDFTIPGSHSFIANGLVVHNTMGMWPGTLTFFVARPSTGKTWSAVIMALHAWQEAKLRVLIVSPELGRVEMGERMVAKYGGFSYRDVVSATLGSLAEPKFYETIEFLKTNGDGLYILDDEDRLQTDYIEQAVEVVQPDLVVIDSLYMLRVERGKVKSGAGSRGDRMERIVETVNWMRQLSRRSWSFAPQGLPVVGIHQLSREGKVKSESARSIKSGRGTGGLEDTVALSDALFWNAHNLFAMYQDQYMLQDQQLMYVPLKVRRQTQVSNLVIRWDLSSMDFREIGTKVGDQAAAEYKDDETDMPY